MGVLIPCILNIFGVILFLLLGHIVGLVGVFLGALSYTMAYTVVTITALSVSAISTNGKIKGGGSYYLISRALGPEFGGAIGVIFFFANVVGGAFYVVGFGDAVAQLLPDRYRGYWFLMIYRTVCLLFIGIICLLGADLFAKTSLLIFFILMFSLGSVIISFCAQKGGVVPGYTGLFRGYELDTFYSNAPMRWNNFTTAFGILFPGTAGIMAGANMSGDLENPGKSIPSGTLGAIVITYVTYVGLIFLFGFTVHHDVLLENIDIITDVNFFSLFVSCGIWAATFSSGLAVVIGGSRVLQALANDKLLPFVGWLGKGYGKNNEPRRAVLLTWALTQAVSFIQDVRDIAPLVTVFLVITFFFVNIACFILQISGAPNFRPDFKWFGWPLALLGAVLCVIVMFVVNALFSLVTIVILVFFLVVIHFYAPPTKWGDISQALIYHQVRKYLLKLDIEKEHVKFWRPQILLLVANPKSSFSLIDFVNNLKKGGLYVIGNVKVGNLENTHTELVQDRNAFYQFIKDTGIKAFSSIVISKSIREGCQNLVLTSGMGGMTPNTVVIGFYDPSAIPQEDSKGEKHIKQFSPLRKGDDVKLDESQYVCILKDIVLLEKNLLMARNFNNLNKSMLTPIKVIDKIVGKKERFIDMWWPRKIFLPRHRKGTISLTLQFGCIIKMVGIWSRYHTLRLINFVPENDEKKIQKGRARLKAELKENRVSAKIVDVSLLKTDFIGISDLSNYRAEKQSLIECFKKLTRKQKWGVVNRAIKRVSENTSVIFHAMPNLPPTYDDKVAHANFIEELEILTSDLPPTLLIRGKGVVMTKEF